MEVDVILNQTHQYYTHMFQIHINDRYIEHFRWNCPQVNARGPYGWLIKIGPGNGLVPSGNNPVPELMLIKYHNAIWRDWSTTIEILSLD